MDAEDSLMELEETYNRLSCLLSALELMVLGLMEARDPYARGFNALFVCMAETDLEIRRRLSSCQRR